MAPVWFIGTWEYQSCDPKNILCLVKDFTFNVNGTYAIDAYPPARHRGNYKMKSFTATEAVLDLSNQKGDWAPWKPQIKLTFDVAKNTITIDGEGPYTKSLDVKSDHFEPNEH